jgi:hypothetical protein
MGTAMEEEYGGGAPVEAQWPRWRCISVVCARASGPAAERYGCCLSKSAACGMGRPGMRLYAAAMMAAPVESSPTDLAASVAAAMRLSEDAMAGPVSLSAAAVAAVEDEEDEEDGMGETGACALTPAMNAAISSSVCLLSAGETSNSREGGTRALESSSSESEPGSWDSANGARPFRVTRAADDADRPRAGTGAVESAAAAADEDERLRLCSGAGWSTEVADTANFSDDVTRRRLERDDTRACSDEARTRSRATAPSLARTSR